MHPQQLLARLKAMLSRTPAQRADELDHPSGYEPGLRHRHNAGLVLCRDDGVVELSSGPAAAVLVDGPAQAVMVKGSGVEISGTKIELNSDQAGLYVNGQRLNPYWLSGPLDPTFAFKAPLVLNLPADLNTVLCTLPPVVPGAPVPAVSPTLAAQGVLPRPLWSLMTPRPLFGPNERLLILARNLAEMVQSLAHVQEHLNG